MLICHQCNQRQISFREINYWPFEVWSLTAFIIGATVVRIIRLLIACANKITTQNDVFGGECDAFRLYSCRIDKKTSKIIVFYHFMCNFVANLSERD